MKLTELNTAEKIVMYVRDELVRQNCRSANNDDDDHQGCMYRGKNDTKCGVGYLISDKYYMAKFEASYLAGDEVIIEAVEASLERKLNPLERNMLKRIQSIHDTIPVNQWPMMFDRLLKKVRV